MPALAPLTAIEPLVQARLDEAGAPGAALAISIDGERWSTGVGHADLARTVPMPADARCSAYSITKTVVAAMTMRLVDERALGLDNPVQQYLPDLPIATPVGIRQLLNHTGGFPDYGGLSAYHEAVRAHPGEPWNPDDYLAHTLGDDLLFMPGHGWRYSNIGYMLLRLVLEQEVGLRFPALVRHVVARPLGLDDLRGVATLADMAGVTPGYSMTLEGGDVPDDVTGRYHPGWVAHGLVVSTALDLARFLDALLAGDLFIDKGLVGEMLLEAPVDERHPWMVKPAYGLGLMIDPANPFGRVAGHTGGGPGFATAAYHFPDVAGHAVTIVALVNRDGADTGTAIAFSLASHLAETLPGG